MGMNRLSLDEAIRQRPKTLEQLERVRKIYMRQVDRADKDGLLKLQLFFRTKEAELTAHEFLLKRARLDYPRIITDEMLASKSRMIMLWKGLREEVERRLGW